LDNTYDAHERGYDPSHPTAFHFKLGKDNELVPLPYDTEWMAYRVTGEKVKLTPEELKRDWGYLSDNNLPVPDKVKDMLVIMRKGVSLLVQESQKRGIDVVLGYTSVEGTKGELRGRGHWFYKFIADVADETGAEFVDLTTYLWGRKAMPGQREDNHYWPQAGHWSPAGHHMVAQSLADFIANKSKRKAKPKK
jgi:hypothetical protein